MNKIIPILLCFCPTFSYAAEGGMWKDVNFIFKTNCLSVDQVPITDKNVAAYCCNGSSLKFPLPPDTAPPAPLISCSAAFDNISGDGAGNGPPIIPIAQSQLAVLEELNNTQGSDYTGSTPTDTAGTGGPGSESNASIAGSNSGSSRGRSGFGYQGKGGLNPFGGMGASGGGSGGGAGGGQAGGAGGGVASAGGTGGSGAKKSDGEKSAEESGRSGGSGGGSEGAAGGDAATAEAGKYTGESTDDLVFGETAADKEALAKAAANGTDPDGTGSPFDPNDYFNRIHPSANIFKIVTARYHKKKTLIEHGMEIRNQAAVIKD